MAKLTHRDRRLLYLLALALFIFAVVYWAVLPAARMYLAAKAEYSVSAVQNKQISGALLDAPAVQKDIEDLTAELEAVKSGFMHLATQGEVDMYITGLIQDFGLFPVSMAVTPPAERTFAPYDSESARAKLFGNEAPTLVDNFATAFVWSIDAVFSGTLADFIRFTDTLESQPGLYLQSFGYTSPSSGEAYTFSVEFIGVSAS